MVSEDGFPETEDAFLFFHRVVKKDALDAATFDAISQAGLMCMMIENLELLEKVIYQIKAMLKEPDFNLFKDVKDAAILRIRASQLEMNPKRPNTPELNTWISKKN